jgi:L-threonylcarbamoyladenylate synthase
MELINNPTLDEIKKAAKALNDGHLVAFPTETVYGLGADATNEEAVSRIYSVKGRPKDHPLIVHISSINQLSNWARDIPEYAIKLAKEFWPGPMTLILKRSKFAKDFITGGQDSVALRVPDHLIALDLLTEFEKLGGFGIAAPSANRFGAVSPTTAEAVVDELGEFLSEDELILNGGPCSIGIESTIIDCTTKTPRILRPGAITVEMIETTTGYKIPLSTKNIKVRASGLLGSHYSPSANVVIATTAQPGDGFIAMENIPTPTGGIRLASPSSINQYAKVFYSALREGDRIKLGKIVVVQPLGEGLAEAIRNRLEKAANKKQN